MNKLVLLKYFFFLVLLLHTNNLCAKTDSIGLLKKTKTEKTVATDQTKNAIPKYQSNLKEAYNSNSFDYKEKAIEEGLWDRFKKWLAQKLANLFSNSNPVAIGNTVEFILKTIALLIILFAIYTIVRLLLNKEGKWIFGRAKDKKVIHHQDIEKNLQNVDFEKLIKQTIQAGNKRLAIRYYYLWLLKKLTQKSIITWHPEKTTNEYFNEIKNQNIKSNFDYASYLYTYIWYGEFELDDATFETAKTTFEKTIQSI